MEMKLHFDILIKEGSMDMVDIDILKGFWPAYYNNIHVVTDTTMTDFNSDIMVKARLLEGGRQICAVSRFLTSYEKVLAATTTDGVDYIMEEVLKRMNKTQNTAFSRHVSCIGYIGPAIKQHFIFPPELLVKRYRIPELERLHSSGPVSVAIWSNGKKSMVRKQKGDKSDPEKGILYAVIKGLCYEKGGTKEYSRVLDMIHEALEERKNG